VRLSPSQRANSSRDLINHRIGTESDIVQLKAEILHNQRQLERIRHHNVRLIARLAEIEGRDISKSAPNRPPASNRVAENDQRLGGARSVKFNRRHRRRTAWLARCSIAVIFAIGCGWIGFAIARSLLK
jgi:hypothetical protein